MLVLIAQYRDRKVSLGRLLAGLERSLDCLEPPAKWETLTQWFDPIRVLAEALATDEEERYHEHIQEALNKLEVLILAQIEG